MAKGIFERISSIINGTWPEVSYDESSYRQDDGLTGVERYLAKKAEQEQQAAESKLTGVERYLAKQAEKDAEIKKAKAAEKGSGELTGVAKYLQKQADEEEALGKNATGVDKYLSKKKKESKGKKSKDKSPKKEKSKEVKKAKKKKTQKIEKDKPAKSKELIDLSKDASRCQASTSKGSQCKRSNSLETIQRTINKQKYKFSVCSQHKSDDFKPYAELLS